MLKLARKDIKLLNQQTKYSATSIAIATPAASRPPTIAPTLVCDFEAWSWAVGDVDAAAGMTEGPAVGIATTLDDVVLVRVEDVVVEVEVNEVVDDFELETEVVEDFELELRDVDVLVGVDLTTKVVPVFEVVVFTVGVENGSSTTILSMIYSNLHH